MVSGYDYAPPEMPPGVWEKNSTFLRHLVSPLTVREVSSWSPRHVANFVTSIPGVVMLNGTTIVQRIIEEEIDGEAFLLLAQADLVKLLGLKLGPAVKVFNAIMLIKSGSNTNSSSSNGNGNIRDNAG